MHPLLRCLLLILVLLPGSRAWAAEVPRDPAEAAYQRGQSLMAEADAHPGEAATLRTLARKYFRIGAELGSASAMFQLARELSRPEPPADRDLAGAARWYERAASNGVPEAAYNRALMLLYPPLGQQPSPGDAAVWLENAATNGMAAAQNLLGRLYEKGEGRKQSERMAAFLYRAAALQGQPDAQYAWARMIRGGLAGTGPEANPERLTRAAAEQGVAEAQEALAESAAALGTTEADAEATRWFLAAAERGRILAQWNLGLRLRHGTGTPANVTEGAAWMSVASEGMNRNAVQELRDLERDLPAAQWAAVRQRAGELRHQVAERQASTRDASLTPREPGPALRIPAESELAGAAGQESPRPPRPKEAAGEATPGDLPEDYRKEVTRVIWQNFIRLRNDEARKHLADPEFDQGQATITYRLHANGTLTDLAVAPGATGEFFQILLGEAVLASSPFPKWNPKIRAAVGANHVDLVQKFTWDPSREK